MSTPLDFVKTDLKLKQSRGLGAGVLGVVLSVRVRDKEIVQLEWLFDAKTQQYSQTTLESHPSCQLFHLWSEKQK